MQLAFQLASNNITIEISKRKDIQKGETYKIKIIAVTFMNRSGQK